MLPTDYLAIDEEGYPLAGEVRIQDPRLGGEILRGLCFAENGAFLTTVGGQQALVEAFDEPYVVRQICLKPGGEIELTLAYDVKVPAHLDSVTIDEWDRFHGVASNGIPFVLSRTAQADLFNQVDDYDDESLTLAGRRFLLPPWMTSDPKIQTAAHWSNIYQTETPGWELNRPAPALVEMLPRLKLPKMRVLVLGCGSGNDAAHFAEQGHVVTGVDFSAHAIRQAQQKYGHLPTLKFIESDLFKLSSDLNHSFDLIFEHTCFCAIAPEKRGALVQLWNRLLSPQGQLMGVFFAMERRSAPPFGGSEWELRERLKKHYSFVFWGRWKKSTDRRNGKELFVFAQRK